MIGLSWTSLLVIAVIIFVLVVIGVLWSRQSSRTSKLTIDHW